MYLRNVLDLAVSRDSESRAAQLPKLAAERGIPYIETSAATSTNVRELMLTIATEILEARKAGSAGAG